MSRDGWSDHDFEHCHHQSSANTPLTCTELLSAAAPVEAAKRRADNLTWFQAPLINSSSDKATALTTSVVAEGLYSLKRLQHAGGGKKDLHSMWCLYLSFSLLA